MKCNLLCLFHEPTELCLEKSMLYDDGTPNHHFIYTYMLGPITGHSEFNTERKNDISRLFQLF
jgi:hypothetical protein